MARARSASGRAAAGSPRSCRIKARVFRADADVGVLGPVGGFGDGQGAFGQRPGGGQITEIPQDHGEVVQEGADAGMLGPVRGFGDGQGAFQQGPGLPGPALGIAGSRRRRQAARTCPRRRRCRRCRRRGRPPPARVAAAPPTAASAPGPTCRPARRRAAQPTPSRSGCGWATGDVAGSVIAVAAGPCRSWGQPASLGWRVRTAA